MKKIIMPLLLMVFVLTGCSSIFIQEPVNYITFKEVKEKVEKKESFAFVICEKSDKKCYGWFEELDKVKAAGITLDYVNLNNMDEEQHDVLKILEKEEYFGDKLEYIPSTLFIKDGKLIDYLEGDTLGENIIKKYKEIVTK